MRFGCHLRRFKNEPKANLLICHSGADETKLRNKKVFIWHHLNKLLGHRKSVNAPRDIDSFQYNDIEKSMQNIIQTISNGTTCSAHNRNTTTVGPNDQAASTKKRSGQDVLLSVPLSKFPKLQYAKDLQYLSSGSINDFMVGNTYIKMQHIFNQISVIEMKVPTTNDVIYKKTTNKKLSFDLWISQDTTDGPNFRLLIE